MINKSPPANITRAVFLLLSVLIISCTSPSQRKHVEKLGRDGAPVTCTEPPPDVLTASEKLSLDASLPKVVETLRLSLGREDTYKRIRAEIPWLQAFEVLDYRLCLAHVNGILSAEEYGRFLLDVLPLLRHPTTSTPSMLQQFHTGSGDNVGRDKNTIINQRTPYSATQVINNLPPSLGGRDVLNLDNLATLRLLTPLDAGKATLLLDVVQVTTRETPPVEAAPPTIEYLPESPDGTFYIRETLHMSESLSVLAFSPEQKIVFDMGDNKRHEISVGGRTFIITLREIRTLNREGVTDTVEYEFGISESGE